MTLTEIIHTLYQIEGIRFGDFKLKSGQHSPIYLDLRQIISYPTLLRSVASAIWQALGKDAIKAEHICGVPYTALPIATCLSLQHNIPMLMRRKEAKEYGTKKLIEGAFQPGQNCLIIEDVITTGSSVFETASELTKVGLFVTDTAVLIDREQGGKEALQQNDIRVHSVFTLKHILQTLFESNIVKHEDKTLIDSLLVENT